MRGKALGRQSACRSRGITPAYAGKRHRTDVQGVRRWDHPRLCGEKRGSKPPKPCIRGSPPPMRGKDKMTYAEINALRITPAYAGKRFVVWVIRLSGRDHPRLCGEKTSTTTGWAGIAGSPPPMRGKGFQFNFEQSEHRITPAYAGKRSNGRQNPAANWDHPRLCGEKYQL